MYRPLLSVPALYRIELDVQAVLPGRAHPYGGYCLAARAHPGLRRIPDCPGSASLISSALMIAWLS